MSRDSANLKEGALVSSDVKTANFMSPEKRETLGTVALPTPNHLHPASEQCERHIPRRA